MNQKASAPSYSSVLGLRPIPIALAPPDVDLRDRPKLADDVYSSEPMGTQGQSLHNQLPLTGWAKQDETPVERGANTTSAQKGTARLEGEAYHGVLA